MSEVSVGRISVPRGSEGARSLDAPPKQRTLTRRFLQERTAVGGLIIVLFLVLAAIAAPLVAPPRPY